MNKSTIALIAAAGTTAAAAASVPYFLRQNTDLQASHYIFRSPKVHGALEGYRIVQISDLHNKEFGKGNCHLLALIKAQMPDLIVITGDLMDSYHVNLSKAVEFAKRVAKLAPCYFVTGNHEHRMTMEKLTRFLLDLEEAGVRVLRNEAVELGMKTRSISAEDGDPDAAPLTEPASYFRLIGVDCQQGKTDTLQRLMLMRDPEELNILLSHKPHYASYYKKAGVDLVLSGHAHGGQWRLPGVGGLFAPGQGVIPKYTAGMYRIGDTVLCVSRGLGNSSFPLRIENKPEVVTVILRGESV